MHEKPETAAGTMNTDIFEAPVSGSHAAQLLRLHPGLPLRDLTKEPAGLFEGTKRDPGRTPDGPTPRISLEVGRRYRGSRQRDQRPRRLLARTRRGVPFPWQALWRPIPAEEAVLRRGCAIERDEATHYGSEQDRLRGQFSCCRAPPVGMLGAPSVRAVDCSGDGGW
jgi:hypothetical protein